MPSPGFGEQLEEAIDSLDAEGIPGTVPPHQLKKGLKQLGIDLEKIAASLEDAAVFAAGNSQSSLGGALVLTAKGSEASDAVANIGLLLRGCHVAGVTAIGGKASGFSIHSAELGRKPLVVAAKRRADRDRLRPCRRPCGGSRRHRARRSADSSSYKEAVAALGEHPDQRLRRRAGGAALGRSARAAVRTELPGSEALPAKVGYLAIGSGSSGDLATAKLIVGFEQVDASRWPAGVGIDLLEIERLERALERHPRLADRVFTRAERITPPLAPAPHATSRPASPPRRRWSRRSGLSGGFGLREIEVVAGEPPTVRLSGRAAEAAAGGRVEISLTHSRDYAAAVAIAETS